ncbi:MAG: Dabb family protein [bacterium]|nr:Dabb family protein [bacterium]
MFKHIVMWKLTEDVGQKIKKDLENLNSLDCVQKMEVGLDTSKKEASFDVVLYSEFENEDAFAEYFKHPEHKKIVDFLKTVVKDRVVVDYNV